MTEKIVEKKNQKLVYLQWQDAHANGGWFTHDGLCKAINNDAFICEEVGWIVYEDYKEIHLCGRRGLWGKKVLDSETMLHEYGMYQRIPKTWIMKRKVISL